MKYFYILGLVVSLVCSSPSAAEAKTKIAFKQPLDRITVSILGKASNAFNPDVDSMMLMLMNTCGIIFSQALPPQSFTRVGQSFKYQSLQENSIQISKVRIKLRNRGAEPPFIYKIKLYADVDASLSDITRNPGFSEEELSFMILHLHLGMTSLDLIGPWQRYPAVASWQAKGWKRQDRYLQN